MSTVGKSTQLYSQFDPRTIGSCALWLDAADSNTFTFSSGSNVSQWRDKSGNGYNATQSNATYQPSLSSSGVVFSGNQILYTTLESANNAQSWFIVMTWTTGTGKQTVVGARTSGASVAYLSMLSISGTSASPLVERYGSPGVMTSSTTVAANARFLQSATLSGGSSSFLYTNGAQVATTATAPTLSGTGQVSVGAYDDTGASRPGGTPFNGIVNEIVLFSSVLTTIRRQQVEGYLSRKWGFTNPTPTLPVSHPYQLAPPMLRPFTPLDIAECAFWFDAADQTSMTFSGSNVTQWRDKSGNARNANAGATGATFSNNALVFTGTQSYTLSNAGSVLSTTPFSLFIVDQLNYSIGSPVILGESTGNFTSNNTIHVVYLTGGGSLRFAYWNNSLDVSVNATATRLWSLVLPSTGNRYIRQNGALGATAGNATQLASQTGLQIGTFAGAGTNDLYRGNLYEIIGYRGGLSSGDVQQVETYLASKWRLIGNTPSTHIAQLVPPLSSQVLPTTLSNCALWLDAADATTITLSGSNVTQWNDKSGNGRHAVSQGTGPTYSNNSLVFTGSQNMRGSANYLHNSVDGTWSAFAVATTTTVSGGPYFIINYSQTPTVIAQLLRIDASAITSISFTSTGTNYTAQATSISANTRFLAGAVNTTSNVTAYLNGSGGTAVTHPNSNAIASNSNYTVGVYQEIGSGTGFTGYYWNGQISEIVVYSTALSAADRQRVEGYLARKWGIVSNLSTTNPYKITPLL